MYISHVFHEEAQPLTTHPFATTAKLTAYWPPAVKAPILIPGIPIPVLLVAAAALIAALATLSGISDP